MPSISWLEWRCTLGLASASKTTENMNRTSRTPDVERARRAAG